MALVTVNDTTLTDIADAIRSKNGTENTYKPSEMPDAIEAISGGGITPTGTIEITQNGVIDVTNYASADVDVPQGITPTGTKQISITQNGTTTEDVTNYADAEITVNVSGGNPNENLLKLAKDALTSVEIDLGGASMKERTFNSAKALGDIKIWNLGASSGQHICYNCTNLLKAVVTGQGNNVPLPSNTFNNCTKLTAVDLTNVILNQGSAMTGASVMNVLVIRNSAVAPLGNINVFQNTPFASGKAGGTLYVPSSLISSYQGATNWATILGYSTNSIQAIEGSIYENAYVDGTPIPSNS